uniref:Uncharacterized protein n=1 Tax=Zea mays TaxID=4577 RepID=A0A804RLG2_MAIZE
MGRLAGMAMLHGTGARDVRLARLGVLTWTKPVPALALAHRWADLSGGQHTTAWATRRGSDDPLAWWSWPTRGLWRGRPLGGVYGGALAVRSQRCCCLLVLHSGPTVMAGYPAVACGCCAMCFRQCTTAIQDIPVGRN